jgi:hydrogenase nickel incorporation protein HypB
LPLNNLDLLIVENVGNLICTATFELGTHSSVLIASIPEGDDKPYKYPGIYRHIDAVVLNKSDLLPYVEFNLNYFRRGAELLKPSLSIFPMSCYTGADLHRWIDWVEQKCANARSARVVGPSGLRKEE